MDRYVPTLAGSVTFHIRGDQRTRVVLRKQRGRGPFELSFRVREDTPNQNVDLTIYMDEEARAQVIAALMSTPEVY
jgi:hypothetical protein